ncbi:UNVERIFIED_CONTAM: hypothetical protein Slati_1176500 [Sesamum latifolium]|uniref:Uncharacterized protein n=1 Tax=Sesamum latifolium TaxID=2727402 RepID=A0AAW2XD35_9LAMI
MLPSLLEFCGTFIVRQTCCGYSGSTVSTLEAFQFGIGNRRRVSLHSFNVLPTFETKSSLHLAHQRQQFSAWPDGLTSRDSRCPKPMSTSGRNSQDSLGKLQSGRHLSAEFTHSSCGFDHGEDSLHATCIPTRGSIMLVVHQHPCIGQTSFL